MVADRGLRGTEVLLANFAGEDADFVRFNGGSVRQAGSVSQRSATLELIDGRRHAHCFVQLVGEPATDRGRLERARDQLRDHLPLLPEDPYLLYNTEDLTTRHRVDQPALAEPDHALEAIARAGRGGELVGVYASGSSMAGFASSLGQRHWHEVGTFNLDWSFHLSSHLSGTPSASPSLNAGARNGGRSGGSSACAVKHSYAGQHWSDAEFEQQLAWSIRQLEVLDRAPIDLRPGRYRALLAPAAMVELTDMLSWGGFGLRAQRTRQSPLLRLLMGEAAFAPEVRIVEDTAAGMAPAFGTEGFPKPDQVVLVDGGQLADSLVSPRSAQEFGVATNGAGSWEAPQSISLAPGRLPHADALRELGTGLFVGNLWYLNFSDRAACRTTGMTRFATFWVDNGELVAPVNVLRFDDSLFDLLGDKLVGLTDRAEVLLDASSYGARSTASSRVPSALVEEMTFTL